MTKATDNATDIAVEKDYKVLSTRVDLATFEKLDAWRWANRKTQGDVVKLAIDKFVANLPA